MSGETLVTILPRFRGPPGSANGGYFAGAVAALCDEVVTVRLQQPPPLGVALRVAREAPGRLSVWHGEREIAVTRPAQLLAPQVDVVPYMSALAASRHFSGFTHHAFPGCFVCGTERTRGDGLRVFAGRLPDAARVAAPWVPDATLAAPDGKIATEYISAALDCPGYFALVDDARQMLLGEFTVHIGRRLHVDEPAVIVGWAEAHDGRRHYAMTAMLGQDGSVCAHARALWIEPRDRPDQHPSR